MKTRTRKKKPEAVKELFSQIKAGKTKFPRKLRKAVLREMNEEKEKFQKKVKTYASKMSKGSPFPNRFDQVHKLPSFKSRFVELFDENFKGVNFQMPDLMGGRGTHKGKIGKIIWLEKGKVEFPEHDGKPTEVKESIKTVDIKPDGIKEYFKSHKVELKESSQGQGGFDGPFWQGQVSVSRNDGGSGKYFPYPPSSFTRQMYIPDSWFMLARAAHVSNYNPMAKAAMDIKTSFIIGNGPKIIINNNDDLDTAWSQFEKTEDFIETIRTWCSMLTANGELFVEFYRKQTNNEPTVRSIDPGHVYEIITEPRDIRTVYGYKLMYQTQYQIFGEGAKGEVVPLSEWIYETIVPDNIMHIKVNVQENEKRGRSDFLAGMAILQLFEDYIRYKVLRAIVEAAFVWDVEMNGADEAQITEFLNDEQQAFPEPGQTRAHNENVKWAPLSNTAGAGSNDEVFEMLLVIFAVSMNLPKEYMGSGKGGTRATAITSTEPSVKAFTARRHKIEGLILRIVDFVAQSKGITYDPDQVEVAWEEIAPEDIKSKVERLYTELDRNTLTKKRVDEMIAKLEGISNYAWDDEMTNRLLELTSGITQSLDNAGPVMVGSGMDIPEKGKPVVQVPPTPGAGSATPAVNPSGAPSSMSGADKKAIKKTGQNL